MYYYKSTRGSEIDLILEEEDHIKVIGIKSSRTIQKSDLSNLKDFKKAKTSKKIKGFLFYGGENYEEVDEIKCLPIACLYRGIRVTPT